MSAVLGLHHVTAIAGDPQRNLVFYVGVLGLRLVKRTVNFDDPETYHFYFGDEVGTPGSILTFFPWPGARSGRQGTGQVAVTSLAILPGAVGFWVERLVRHGIAHEGPTRRETGSGVEQVLAFKDPDGLLLELVGHPGAESRPWLVDLIHWGNPLTPAIETYRTPLYAGELPPAADAIYLCVAAVVALVVGALVFNRVDDRIASEA